MCVYIYIWCVYILFFWYIYILCKYIFNVYIYIFNVYIYIFNVYIYIYIFNVYIYIYLMYIYIYLMYIYIFNVYIYILNICIYRYIHYHLLYPQYVPTCHTPNISSSLCRSNGHRYFMYPQIIYWSVSSSSISQIQLTIFRFQKNVQRSIAQD